MRFLLWSIVLGGWVLSSIAQTSPEEPIVPALVKAARGQIGVTTAYDPAYVSLEFPGGDVPADRGVCTDVLIRALRVAHQIDLQEQVNRDMKANFPKYPKIWGLSRTDRNIDHRRVPNLQVFFERAGAKLPLTEKLEDFEAGEVVTCIVPPHLPHVMIVSARRNADGVPLVIHNIGRGTQEEDRLADFELTGRYRFPIKTAP